MMHEEKLSLLLIEGKSIEKSTSLGQFKYFKIVINDQAVESFTVSLLTLHGDTDLLLSRENEFPNGINYWKKSTWNGEFPDIIKISKDEPALNGTLIGTYYLSVFAD